MEKQLTEVNNRNRHRKRMFNFISKSRSIDKNKSDTFSSTIFVQILRITFNIGEGGGE